MENAFPFLISLLLGFIPMFFYAAVIYFLDRFEKEPLLLLGAVFGWGAIVSAAGAFIVNTAFGEGVILATHSEGLANLVTGVTVAPLFEESLKGLAVLLVFWIFHNEFDSILDGIVYAAVVALGFAATENTYYIYNLGYLKGGWDSLWATAFIRTVVVGLQHPFFTSFLGIGLAYGRLHRNHWVKLAAPILGWFVSIFMHSFHNSIAILGSGAGCWIGSLFDWSGWLAMFVFIILMGEREKGLLKQYLLEEIDLNNIHPDQYITAQSTQRQLFALFKGNFWITVRFYQLCAELSHKKNQYIILGDEDGNLAAIGNLRSEMSRLSLTASA